MNKITRRDFLKLLFVGGISAVGGKFAKVSLPESKTPNPGSRTIVDDYPNFFDGVNDGFNLYDNNLSDVFDGGFGSLSFWARPLSAEEIAKTYEQNIPHHKI